MISLVKKRFSHGNPRNSRSMGVYALLLYANESRKDVHRDLMYNCALYHHPHLSCEDSLSRVIKLIYNSALIQVYVPQRVHVPLLCGLNSDSDFFCGTSSHTPQIIVLSLFFYIFPRPEATLAIFLWISAPPELF